MFDKKVLNIYAFIVGLFFLVSGFGKVIDTTAFSSLIYRYGLGYLMILSPLIVIGEILLGLLLVLLMNPRRNALFSFILLTLFTASFAYAHVTHGINNCGCLGSLQRSNISPLLTFIRNGVLMLMSLLVWLKYPKENEEPRIWKKYVLCLFICPAIFVAGLTFTVPNFFKADIDKPKFQDQQIKNTSLSKFINTSSDSTYLVFCFTYTCPHCWNSIANLQRYEKSRTADRVMAFATGNDSTRQAFVRNFQPDFQFKNLPLDSMLQLTDMFPTTFYIKHDSIKVVIQGELPSHVLFRTEYASLFNHK